ncbi:MetI-like domain [Moorella glycerini]|uniref:Aliphatic sulfonates transport permease protein SsuC n=1 Tax=Neomoorella stamsii TaxID=1266720 RepID=A0A9X7P756_9FIRM|nr:MULTISPECIES: ABC transporter permease [Moorella]PRR76097.1 putative aliphatic sulfonates transport permease protein SsuC [Moorella stamsii]CEP68297.1 MetI-like domain [Moorella glycerini]
MLLRLKSSLSTLFIILLVSAWELIFHLTHSQGLAVPAPSEIIRALFGNFSVFISNLPPTIIEAVGGFILGNLIGILVAVIFVRYRNIEETLFPLVVLLHSIPALAIIPILIIWFGNGYASKVALTTLVSFFPTLVNMVKGLKSVNRQTLEMMTVLGAKESTVFWKVRLPSSLPYLFAGFKIAAPASVLGAVVAEWLGARRGIGFLMLWEMFNYEPPMLWAAMLISALLTMSSFFILSVLEKLVIPWHESVTQGGR